MKDKKIKTLTDEQLKKLEEKIGIDRESKKLLIDWVLKRFNDGISIIDNKHFDVDQWYIIEIDEVFVKSSFTGKTLRRKYF